MTRRTPRQTAACPRCGKVLDCTQNQHYAACYATPIPAELVAIYRADDSVTIGGLAKEFGTSPTFIQKRLLDGGVTEDEIRRRRYHHAANNGEKVAIPAGARKCRTCGILIYRDRPRHDGQYDHAGSCGVCAGVMPVRVVTYEMIVQGW